MQAGGGAAQAANTSLYDTYTVSISTGPSTSQPSANGIDATIDATR